MYPRRITKIVVEELSLVKNPANRRRALMYKAEGKMKLIASMMADRDMDEATLAEAAKMSEERVHALLVDDAEPTDDEMSAMMSAMKGQTKKGQTKKAMHGGMKRVMERMEECGIDAEAMADMADIDKGRMKELMAGDSEPTDEEVEAMESACDTEEEHAKKENAVPPELEKHISARSESVPTSYDDDGVMSALSGLAKEWDTEYNSAPRRDGEPDGVNDADRAREAGRIDAHGIATVNSGALYPDIHVPPVTVVGGPQAV